MTQQTSPEAALPLVREHFQDAISALIDPQYHQLDYGRGTYLDPLLSQIHDAVAGQTGERSGSNIRRLPFWPAAHDILEEITATVRDWTPEEHHTAGAETRLRVLYGQQWRPQDVPTLESYTRLIGRWVAKIRDTLDPPLNVPLDDPCPLCGKEWVRRNIDGENVKQRALTIRGDEGAAVCGHCRAMWEPARLPLLGRMLESQRKGAHLVTVAELIEKLSNADPDAIVVTDNPESFHYVFDFDVSVVPAEVTDLDHALGPMIRQFDSKRSKGDPVNVIVLSRFDQGGEAVSL